jgi:hypothetical protein
MATARAANDRVRGMFKSSQCWAAEWKSYELPVILVLAKSMVQPNHSTQNPIFGSLLVDLPRSIRNDCVVFPS